MYWLATFSKKTYLYCYLQQKYKQTLSKFYIHYYNLTCDAIPPAILCETTFPIFLTLMTKSTFKSFRQCDVIFFKKKDTYLFILFCLIWQKTFTTSRKRRGASSIFDATLIQAIETICEGNKHIQFTSNIIKSIHKLLFMYAFTEQIAGIYYTAHYKVSKSSLTSILCFTKDFEQQNLWKRTCAVAMATYKETKERIY